MPRAKTIFVDVETCRLQRRCYPWSTLQVSLPPHRLAETWPAHRKQSSTHPWRKTHATRKRSEKTHNLTSRVRDVFFSEGGCNKWASGTRGYSVWLTTEMNTSEVTCYILLHRQLVLSHLVTTQKSNPVSKTPWWRNRPHTAERKLNNHPCYTEQERTRHFLWVPCFAIVMTLWNNRSRTGTNGKHGHRKPTSNHTPLAAGLCGLQTSICIHSLTRSSKLRHQKSPMRPFTSIL